MQNTRFPIVDFQKIYFALFMVTEGSLSFDADLYNLYNI